MKKNKKALEDLRQDYERSIVIVNEASFLQEYKSAKELRKMKESAYCLALIGRKIGSIGLSITGKKRMLLGGKFDLDGKPIQITIMLKKDGTVDDSYSPQWNSTAQIIEWL